MDDAGAGHVIRWWVPLGILVIGLAGGAVLGAATNVVNGSVSGEYFSIVMGWNSIEAPFLAIPQGMLEGSGLGAGFGIVVAISFAASTKLRGRSDLALRAWGIAVLVALVCWGAGGGCGVAIASCSPNLFHAMFPQSRAAVELVRYAWVGGSIWGGYGGTVVGSVVACIYLHVRWRRECRRADGRFEVLQAAR
jgi:hypothetical protein